MNKYIITIAATIWLIIETLFFHLKRYKQRPNTAKYSFEFHLLSSFQANIRNKKSKLRNKNTQNEFCFSRLLSNMNNRHLILVRHARIREDLEVDEKKESI